jgi:hypothetical protein
MSDDTEKQNIQMAEDEHAHNEVHKVQTIDTTHKDEAMKVLATYDGDQTWTPEEERSVRRKIDWRLMPVLCATYGLQYYDKAMLSQAVSHPANVMLKDLF